ncbi:MAG: hypothetical protein JWP17_2531, partial [Solirubrobacterales bacterium]|nr:hypothetical protein [Solirubrobacterales bacterium]
MAPTMASLIWNVRSLHRWKCDDRLTQDERRHGLSAHTTAGMGRD